MWGLIGTLTGAFRVVLPYFTNHSPMKTNLTASEQSCESVAKNVT